MMRESRISLLKGRTFLMVVALLAVTKQVVWGSPLDSSTGSDVAKVGGASLLPSDRHHAEEEIEFGTNLTEDDIPMAREKKVAKRSIYEYEAASENPYPAGYLQSLHYNPLTAWGRQRRSGNLRAADARSMNSRNEDYPPPDYEVHQYPNDAYMDTVFQPHHFFHGFKRASIPFGYASKRSPHEMGARGFHENIFTHNFGDFSPVRRRKRDAEAASRVSPLEMPSDPNVMEGSGGLSQNYPPFGLTKRRFGMDASGFHGDTFNDGWGTFSTMRKRRPEWDSSGFHGDMFSDGFGSFDTMKKRRPEMDASGFHGDTFSSGFGDFYTMKRRPEMDSSGFHSDMFSNGFGDFYTMKKSSEPSGDRTQDRVKRETIKPNRRPEMTASGFHGDTFSNGFGDFYTMKRGDTKRRPEMTASGFHGDTFSNGFGDFYTMRKRLNDLENKMLELRLADVSTLYDDSRDEQENASLQQELRKENGER